MADAAFNAVHMHFLRSTEARAREYLLEAGDAPYEGAPIFSHRCRIDTGGVLAGDFKLKIFDSKGQDGFGMDLVRFRGTTGGVTLGGLAGAGTIDCWIPPQSLSNQEGRFTVASAALGFAGAVAVLWNRDGRLIGVAVISGGGLAVNFAGGAGRFGEASPCYLTSAMDPAKVVDLDRGSWSSGAKIQLWQYLGTPNQQWRLQEAEPDYFYVVSVLTDKAITVKDASSEPGALLVQWEKNGGDNQKWKLLATDSKSRHFAFSSKSQPSMVIDLSDGNVHDGTPLQQWNNLGQTNQAWGLSSYVHVPG